VISAFLLLCSVGSGGQGGQTSGADRKYIDIDIDVDIDR